MSPEKGLLADIDERPEDGTPRLVYADWLEEQGRADEAFCQRWMVRHGKRPGDRRGRPHIQARYSWGWWAEGMPDYPPVPRHAALPLLVFLALEKARYEVGHRYYPGRQEAEAALRKALTFLRELLSV
jgi:uncharacterized protein (TIGR02996 family)